MRIKGIHACAMLQEEMYQAAVIIIYLKDKGQYFSKQACRIFSDLSKSILGCIL